MSGILSNLPIPPLSLGVFATTPSTCGVMGLLASGNAFAKGILGEVADLQNHISSVIGNITGMANSIIGTIMGDISGLISQLTATISGVLGAFISHLEGQFTNLVNNLTVAVAQAGAGSGLASSGCGLPSAPPVTQASPCGNMNSMFGSITGLGSAALGAIGNKVSDMASHLADISGLSATLGGSIGLGDISAKISSAMDSVHGALSGITDAAGKVTDMITGETNAIASALSDMIAFGGANALLALKSNQCAHGVLTSVGSPSLLSHLGI